MNGNEKTESLAVSEATRDKMPPRLLRTLSSDSNLQTMSLGNNTYSDGMVTISLAEIGGIPQNSEPTAPLDPNLLTGLSPETLNMMTSSFQFLTPVSAASSEPPAQLSPISADLPMSSTGDLEPLTRSSTDSDTSTATLTNTHPVAECLISSALITSGNGKMSLGVSLDEDCASSSPVASGTMSSTIATISPPAATTGTMSDPSGAVLHKSPRDKTGAPSETRINLFHSMDDSTGTQGDEHTPEETPQSLEMPGHPGELLSEPQLGPSHEGGSPTSPISEAQKACAPSSILSLATSAIGGLSPESVSATVEIQGSPEDAQGSLMDTAGGSVQYVCVTVPNVVINSSGQLVISHVSLVQAPQSGSYIPLVTQSLAAPVISQSPLPDSTSNGAVTLKKKKRKGGWPKGKKRKIVPPDPSEMPKTSPTTSYMIYFRENRERIERANPGATFRDVVKLMSSAWSFLSEDEKQVYTKKAAKLKRQCLSEVKSHSQTDAYQTLVRKKAVKKLKDCEDDFPGSDDMLFMTDFLSAEEDPLNPNELYCKVCDQYFSNIHNKREHLSGRTHVKTVKEKLKDYYELAPPSDTGPESSEEESVRRDLTNLDDIRVEVTDLQSQRELEIKSLKDITMDNIMKNMRLTKELKELQEAFTNLESDLKNLKTIEGSLQAKLNGLRLLMTLFGVLHFHR